MKYSQSPRKIPQASPSGFPLGSGCIVLYIPPLVTIYIQYMAMACTSQYTSIGLYWLIQALRHVLLNTHFWSLFLRTTEFVLKNTLGKVRGNLRV